MRSAPVASLVLLVALVGLPGVATARDWQSRIGDWVSGKWTKTPKGKIFVGEPYDTSRRAAYFPFMKRVRNAVCGSLASQGFRVQQGQADAETYMTLGFFVSDGGLDIDAKVISMADGELVEAHPLHLPSAELPNGWNKRTLRDVARELHTKLLIKTVGQKLSVVFGEFSGGKEEKDGMVSEVSLTLKDFLMDELSSTPAITLIAGKKRSTGKTQHSLQGRFKVVARQVHFRLSLLSPDGRRQLATVTATLPTRQLPRGFALFPENQGTAKKQVDSTTESSVGSDVQIVSWVNSESGIYRDGDSLVVSVRPAVDCYARVYYIQSDGTVFQIFPNAPGDAGKLKGNTIQEIGGPQSPVELTLNDETLGQEFIKIFASKRALDDTALPKQFIDGSSVFHMPGGYKALKRGLRVRGLTVKKKSLRPAAEHKLIIAATRR
jgi:hypothetical protein